MRSANHRVRKALLASSWLFASVALSGCATEEYVNAHIAGVNARIDQTDGRLGALETRVTDVSQRADAAAAAAQNAAGAAQASGAAAQAAATAAGAASADAQRANDRIDRMTAKRKAWKRSKRGVESDPEDQLHRRQMADHESAGPLSR